MLALEANIPYDEIMSMDFICLNDVLKARDRIEAVQRLKHIENMGALFQKEGTLVKELAKKAAGGQPSSTEQAPQGDIEQLSKFLGGG